MVISRLQGGLGNQLFQYAAGFSLSKLLNVDLKLDTITYLKSQSLRELGLSKFVVDLHLATSKEIRYHIPFPKLYRHSPALISSISRRVYREAHFHFDDNFFNCKDPILIDGFWQSQLYFKEHEKEIRQRLQIKPDLIKRVVETALKLQNENSVALHFRRGDYLKKNSLSYHGVLDMDYYKRAIHLVKEKCGICTFHVFSDDFESVKNELNSVDENFHFHHSNSAMEDFYLMSCCKNNIIANSSFSWWAAWLNQNPEKIVIGPNKWFANSEIKINDLFPPDWVRT